jgi:hypothetical protein
MVTIIHNDPGGAKDLVAAAIAVLDNFEDDMVRLPGIMPHGNSFVPVGVKWLAKLLHHFDAVALE